jgi:hypothetical protein
LLEHDLGVSAQVGKVNPCLNRQLGELEIEVVRNCAHYCIALPHEREHGFPIANIEGRVDEPVAGVPSEKGCEMGGMQVRETYFFYLRVLEQIICTRGPLEARAED